MPGVVKRQRPAGSPLLHYGAWLTLRHTHYPLIILIFVFLFSSLQSFVLFPPCFISFLGFGEEEFRAACWDADLFPSRLVLSISAPVPTHLLLCPSLQVLNPLERPVCRPVICQLQNLPTESTLLLQFFKSWWRLVTPVLAVVERRTRFERLDVVVRNVATGSSTSLSITPT
ncbi:Autophagy-related protein 5 [Macrophomina phaseolina MS6]|uniref:Autophagy-related protein 5 n=1 Tax=Macrophomina phaseolina (strain MS6) TaxID=1126212 RepID=K2RX27_MACPH|nr:Autophagy-related protein 5 [Macrophomina phaseolina MS6]